MPLNYIIYIYNLINLLYINNLLSLVYILVSSHCFVLFCSRGYTKHWVWGLFMEFLPNVLGLLEIMCFELFIDFIFSIYHSTTSLLSCSYSYFQSLEERFGLYCPISYAIVYMNNWISAGIMEANLLFLSQS